MAVIDLKHKNKLYYPINVAFNGVGDSFLVSDSRGQVTYFQLANNRYFVINESAKNPVTGVSFTGKYPVDQVFIAFKDKTVETHSLNAKLLDKFNQTHQMEVKNLDLNVKGNLLLSISPDSCQLWTTTNCNSVSKHKALYAKDGVHFTQAKFSPDGQSVVTLLKDGDIIQWSLDTAMKLDSQTLALAHKTSKVTCFDVGIQYMVASGRDLPYLIVRDLIQKYEEFFKLPVGCRGIEKMQLLRDKSLLAFISEGYFYIVDVSSKQVDGRIRAKINIRIPNESIRNFDIDFNMNTVILGTSNGNIYLYDLPKALENERLIAQKKISMGVEEDLVVTFLEPANHDEVSEIFNKSFNQQSSIMTENNQLASFLKPLVTNEQRSISHQEFIVQDSMKTIQNPFIQKSMMEVQQQTLSQYGSQMMSIQSNAFSQANEKQDYLNAGLSGTLANKSNYGKPSASIVKSTMSYNKSTLKNPHRSTISQQQSIITNSQMQSQYRLDEDYQPDFKFTRSTMTQAQNAQFNLPKLRQMLKQFGEYPDKYRFLTWKYLLDLPLNKDSFSNLMGRGIHPVFKHLHKKYPIVQHRLYNKLVRTMSCLGYWSPIFLDADFFPQIVFPFIKTIPNDDLMVFELIMALVMQYLQTWFEGYPSEPMAVLNAVNEIIDKEAPQLSQHLKQCSFTPQVYAWPLLSNLFTEILSKEDWLRLIDHLFTYREDPEIIVYFCAAFLIQSKGAVMGITNIEELHNFQQTTTGIAFKKIMNLTFKLHGKYSQVVFSGHISNNLPLIKSDGQEYPVFSRYPEHNVNNQAKLREKIVLEEEELVKKQQLLEELRIKQEQILMNEELLRKQQEAALKAEVERKKKLQEEQEMMIQQRIRLDEMTRLTKLEHIKKIEEAMMTALTRQEDLKKEEDKVAEEELNQRQRLAKYEYEARMQDEVINNLEFKANQKLLEMMQKQQSEEQIRKMKADFEVRQREEEHRDRIMQEKWRYEDQEQRIKNELLRQTLQQQTQQVQQLAEKAKLEEKFRMQEHQKELQLLQIEEQRRLRALEEDQILKKQQFLEEMRIKGEMQTSIEQERLWSVMNEEREREKYRVRQRMENLEIERERLEIAMEREREERERYEEMERKQRLEKEISQNRSYLSQATDHQRSQAEQAQRQVQMEREEAERRRIEMMKKEIQMREQQNLMQFIYQTKDNINDIVDKGQKEMEEKRLSRGFNTQEQQQPYRMKDSYESKIQERERQIKEQNEMMARKLAEEKENYNLQYQGINPYEPRDLSSSQSSQSYQESSSLMSSNGDADAIKRHYQLKEEFNNYNQTFKGAQQSQQVFVYQPQPPQPPAQLRGHHLPSQTQTIEEGKSTLNQTGKHKQSARSKGEQSYYDSSSSSDLSGDEGSLTSSESAFSGTIKSNKVPLQEANPYSETYGNQTNESGYSSYSSSSQLSSMNSHQYQQYADVRFAGAQGTINPYAQQTVNYR